MMNFDTPERMLRSMGRNRIGLACIDEGVIPNILARQCNTVHNIVRIRTLMPCPFVTELRATSQDNVSSLISQPDTN